MGIIGGSVTLGFWKALSKNSEEPWSTSPRLSHTTEPSDARPESVTRMYSVDVSGCLNSVENCARD